MVKRVLHIGIHCWTSPMRVGSHAIATQFVQQGWEVAYVAAPISAFNFLRPNSPVFQARLQEYRAGGQRDLAGKLWHYVPFSLLAPSNRRFLRSPWLFSHWSKMSWPNASQVVRDAGFGEVDLLFLDSIYQPAWLDDIRYKRCVMRLADYNAGFEGYGAGARQSEMNTLARADLVVTASRGLSQWASEHGAREVMYLPNGVDCERFAGQPPLPDEYAALSGPIAVFVGDISTWVDLALVEACARAMPEVNFVLIGPCVNAPAGMSANVHFLGVRPHQQLVGYLRHAHVGLIPFHLQKCGSLVEHIHPLKLYEYLAAGLPVVSSRWTELEGLQSPAVLCSSTAEFIAAVRAALNETGQGPRYQDYAQSASWPNRLAPLFSWVE
ncbi:glycosyltransferase [Pseudomonas chlororaphis]|uniref:GumK N-terminal domain-containing glycosyltransferase n=1 Tax=Pseudomonas chlororaphis TaxID=587753 RepID=UPI00209AF58D|nr:glycosyltransferase [Pseudomonas chlororaphis]MCO7570128.1 glycosyltransferase [Pseudomonas chlororaphis]MCO7587275.1 glycosyltransferase [Pseudomonas chlororaphis]MCO7610371.1 glycosyltransferase [Pseudomonas chlororaphis]